MTAQELIDRFNIEDFMEIFWITQFEEQLEIYNLNYKIDSKEDLDKIIDRLKNNKELTHRIKYHNKDKIEKILYPFYNEETARNTDDPEILKKIIEFGRSDKVSELAARNKYVTMELLEKFIANYIRNIGDVPAFAYDMVKYALDFGQAPKIWLDEIDNIIKRGEHLPSFATEWAEGIMNSSSPPENWVKWASDFIEKNGHPLNFSYKWAKDKLYSKNPPQNWINAIKKFIEIHKEPPIFARDWYEEQYGMSNKKQKKSSSNWYKTAQNLNYYPPFFLGDKASAKQVPSMGTNKAGLPEWAMSNRSPLNDPIETKLGRQFMAKLPEDLSQEHDITEMQLRKITRDTIEPKMVYEDLLSRDYDKNNSEYKTIEELLEERRPSPLIVPINKKEEINKKTASLNKISTIFGWQNNLSISDGNTFPGLSDRVMAWDDRDEDFAWAEDDIRKQPRYNPEYYGYGYYYQWLEPRFFPEFFSDLTKDYTNTHPAKRFASFTSFTSEDKTQENFNYILKILQNAKDKILNGDLSATRFIISKDMCNFVCKLMDDEKIKIDLFELDKINNEEVFAVWTYKSDINPNDIEFIEKNFRAKNFEAIKDKLEILNPKDNKIDEIIKNSKEICKKYNLNNIYIVGAYVREKKENKYITTKEIDFNCGNKLICSKFFNLLSRSLGVTNKKYKQDKKILEFNYKGIIVRFFCGFRPKEIVSLMRNNKIELSDLFIDLCNRDFNINMGIYNVFHDSIYYPLKKYTENNKIDTLFDPEDILVLNPEIAFRAIKLKIENNMEISERLEKAIISKSEYILSRIDKNKIDKLIEQIKGYGDEKAEKILREYNLMGEI